MSLKSALVASASGFALTVAGQTPALSQPATPAAKVSGLVYGGGASGAARVRGAGTVRQDGSVATVVEDPQPSVYVAASGFPSYASAILTYYFSLSGVDAGAGLIPIHAAYTAIRTNTSLYPFSFTSLDISNPTSTVHYESFVPGTVDGAVDFTASAGDITKVKMEAEIAFENDDPANVSGTAYIDPYFTIGSDYLAAHPGVRLDFSDDVGNAPPAAGAVVEPASWALMIVGFGIAGASFRRRKHALGI